MGILSSVGNWLGSAAGSNVAQGLIGAGAGYALQQQDIGALKDLRSSGANTFAGLQQSAQQAGQFTPFTIASAGGNVSANAQDGAFSGLNMSLNPQLAQGTQDVRGHYFNHINNWEQVQAPTLQNYKVQGNYMGALPGTPEFYAANIEGVDPFAIDRQQAAFGQPQIAQGLQGYRTAEDIIGNLDQGPMRSEQDIYEMLERMQDPSRERGRLALRDELAAQGRLGVGTAAYGGTPEELARAKAVEEARAMNAFNAYQLRGADQQRIADQRLRAYQQGEMGAGRYDQSLLASFGMADQSQRTANDLTNILGQLALGGRGQDLNAMLEAANQRNRFSTDIFAQQSQNAFNQGQLAAQAEQTAVQNALGMANANVGMFNAQANQQLGMLDAADAAYRSSFLPEDMMLRQAGLGGELYGLAQRGRIAGEELYQQAGTNQVENAYNIEGLLAEARQNQNNMLLQMLMGTPTTTSANGTTTQGNSGILGDIWGSIFKGGAAPTQAPQATGPLSSGYVPAGYGPPQQSVNMAIASPYGAGNISLLDPSAFLFNPGTN